ncbi:TraR/DksA C4-type zinc finger protein [Providencia vermicola]|uniref:TraR/DksA C4-type zinc finger protein n=1 Tax=Providencia vermicola TaxID=333965 RepID=UPI002AB3EDB4|nr:TraR/DksA C4-type zinc finger protein [Providencia stuartii]
MADEIDVSQAESEFLLSLRLSQRAKYQGQSAKVCVECGENIPLARRIALPGVQHCVNCIERQEYSRLR